MKKSLKVKFIILGVLVGIVAVDTLQAKIFNNSPLLKIRENFNGGSIYYVDKGIFVNHYYCSNKEEKTLYKDVKYNCPLEENPKNINIENYINKIVTSGPNISSNPFDYIKASEKEYKELLNNPKETFEYAINDLISSNAGNGLKSYIEALLCSEINKNFEYDFESGIDYLEHYKKFLTECDCIYNEYDNYTKSLLK